MANVTTKDLRRQRRTLEALDRAISRSELDRAIAALGDLPDDLRQRKLPAVAALFGKTVRALHGKGDWGPLATLAVRALAQPDLLAPGGGALDPAAGSADSADLRWALLWGCARCKDWVRAERIWKDLEPAVRAVSGTLAGAMAAYIAGSGAAPSPLVEAAIREARGGPASAADDGLPAEGQAQGQAQDLARDEAVRLGYDPGQKPSGRTSVAAAGSAMRPGSAAEAERAVLVAYTGLPWAVFADTIARWARTGEPDVTAAILGTAVRVALWEQLRRTRAGKGTETEPLRLAARGIGRLGAPAELAEEALLACRLATTGLDLGGPSVQRTDIRPVPRGTPPRKVLGAARAEIVAECAGALLRYPGMRHLVEALAAGLVVDPPARPAILRVFEGLLGSRPDAALWCQAIVLWAPAGDEPMGELPGWLVESLEAILGDGRSIAAVLERLPHADMDLVLEVTEAALPVATLDRLLTALWPEAGSHSRDHLAGMIDHLIDAVEAPGLVAEAERLMLAGLKQAAGFAADPDDLFHETMEELLERNRAARRLSSKALDVWRRLGEPALPHSRELLLLGLQLARGAAEAEAIVDRYMGQGKDPERFLEALEASALAGSEAAMLRALDGLVGAFRAEPAGLHDLLRSLVGSGAPRFIRDRIARGVLEGDDAAGGVLPPRDRAWVESLLGLDAGRKKKAKARAKPGRRSAAKAGAKAEAASETRPRGRSGAKVGAKAGAKPENKARAKAGPSAAGKAKACPETAPQAERRDGRAAEAKRERPGSEPSVRAMAEPEGQLRLLEVPDA